ncbi:LRC42 protein, partial [Polyodon spathula]|nr:LRC42 protein [Polyodon spathula]
MPYLKGSDSDYGPVYIREKGELRLIADPVNVEKVGPCKIKPHSHLKKCGSVRFCNREGDQTTSTKNNDPVFLTLRYSAKPLFDIALGFVADNVQYIDSLIGFPEQVAKKLFAAAEERKKFVDPGAGLQALQTFSKAYGSLVLSSLCLKSRYLLVSEKLEEIKSFQGLSCLDLSSCQLGDDHELLQHLTTEALSSLVKLGLGDNCLSDSGLRKMTAPVRVMKRGLKNLELLDLSCKTIIITIHYSQG